MVTQACWLLNFSLELFLFVQMNIVAGLIRFNKWKRSEFWLKHKFLTWSKFRLNQPKVWVDEYPSMFAWYSQLLQNYQRLSYFYSNVDLQNYTHSLGLYLVTVITEAQLFTQGERGDSKATIKSLALLCLPIWTERASVWSKSNVGQIYQPKRKTMHDAQFTSCLTV